MPRLKPSPESPQSIPKMATKKSTRKSKKADPAFEHIVELVKSLQGLYRQSYELQRPIVEDMCANPDTVTEHDLERCFDQVLEISCTDFGMELFNRLCQTFKSRYPESVADYMEIQNDMYGEDSDDDVEDTYGT